MGRIASRTTSSSGETGGTAAKMSMVSPEFSENEYGVPGIREEVHQLREDQASGMHGLLPR
jgi:hypothetical protein